VAALVRSGSHQEIYESHTQAWKHLWEDGKIELEGNLELSKTIYACLYYILTSLPVTTDTYSAVGQFYGVSPGGLAQGHMYRDFQGMK
jgi:trehalose/maltose hydrolase-like predicted phosphorylase